ncbi:cytochrome P450 [Auricularia subglabra TFB-10046 SS5]|uniref:Cytochrome P450 n=1 Tax=Auricularia subglabra (strain TFB-10046 / SS5) TaxID=717982 RepID=J0D1V6_AURST|nr:cytochrome P450 [Auricularia subglabra TFB-10046 SS5]
MDTLFSSLLADAPATGRDAFGISTALFLVALVLGLPSLKALICHLAPPTKPLHDTSLGISQLPSLSSNIPVIGHILELQYNSAAYVIRLLASTSASLFTIRIPFKTIVFAHPSMDRVLSRHVSDTGLAQLLAPVGRRVFGLGEDAVRAIVNVDPRPLHRAEFGRPENLQRLTKQASRFLWDELERMPPASEVDLGRWMFKTAVAATACAVWGYENPWRMDDEFAEQFRILSAGFASLSWPFPWITARKALSARNFLLTRLRAFHAQHRATRIQSVAHGINIIAQSDPDWEANADYYSIELVSALGVLASPSMLSVWLMRHLLAAPSEFLDRVVKEAQSLSPHKDGKRLDVSDVRTRCPWLVAAWHETLRLHMTTVPRIARHPFSLPLQDSAQSLSVDQGDIIVLPMCASNRNPDLWAEPSSFAPERFITADGRLDAALVSRVRAFGVAGNLCPGREFGSNVALAIVAGFLRTFAVHRVDGGDGPLRLPSVARGFNLGLERPKDDVRIRLVKI